MATTPAGDDEGLPFTVLFARGEAAARSCAQGTPPSQEALQRGVDSLRAAWMAVRRAALFSRNESKDDLATPAIKYLLTPFYLAELLAQLQQKQDRIALLEGTLPSQSAL